MTEEEWLTVELPDVLLDYVKAQKLSNSRRDRLFGCGCFRIVWDRIGTDLLAGVVDLAEARADRRVKHAELGKIHYPRIDLSDNTITYVAMATHAVTVPKTTPGYVAWLVRVAVDHITHVNSRYGVPDRPQSDLIRDIFGNPFRPVTFDPRWRSSDVVGLARAIYDDKAFERMPILADALMDAGCEDEQIIGHCRGDGPHVRGCWVVDLILGKE